MNSLMNGHKMDIIYGADLTMLTAKTAKSNEFSVMYIMSGMTRGIPKVLYMLLKLHSNILSSVSFLSSISIFKKGHTSAN